MRPCAIRLLTRAICRGSDYQRVEILGQDLTSLFQDLWKKSVVTDTKEVCELQDIVQCSGFFDSQCVVPSRLTTEQIIAHCPAQYAMYKSTGDIVVYPSPAVTNDTLKAASEQEGFSVGDCLEDETGKCHATTTIARSLLLLTHPSTEYAERGCFQTLARILEDFAETLFIPGIVLACYFFLLAFVASYLTCCTLCRVV